VGLATTPTQSYHEAFLLDTRCTSGAAMSNNSRCVDDADLLQVLFAFGNTAQQSGATKTSTATAL
jgi:hypothetical protein